MDEDLNTLCTSTEEMVAGIEKVNRSNVIKELVAFSMDVEKLFPSLKAEEVAKVVAKEYLKSKLNIKVDNAELSLYLAIVKDPSEIETLGLKEVINTRRGTRGAKPGITTSEILKEDRSSKFNPPEREPTMEESKLMFSLALEEAIKAVMSNHLYSFNGEVKRQESGGPIGLKLSGSLAKVYMLYWSRCFIEAMGRAMVGITSFMLYLLKIYVDDTNLLCEVLPPGSRYKDGVVTIVEEAIEEDKDIPGDLRTARILTDIANTVSPFIKLTFDCPSLHNDGIMPLLDLGISVKNNKVEYQFYRKEMASQFLIMKRSAMPLSIKRASLIQEGVRILRNTAKSSPWSSKAKLLSDFSNRMRISGYHDSFRLHIIKAAVEIYENQVAEDEAGRKPLYREKSWNKEDRRNNKLITKTAWYRPAEAVGCFPATPGGELNRIIQSILDEEGARIDLKLRAVEKGGISLRRQLVKTDIGPPGCNRPNCYPCQGDNPGASHTRAGALYHGTCSICANEGVTAEYWGETSRSAYTRSLEHADDIRRKQESNAFHKHLAIYHPNEVGKTEAFKIKVEQTYTKNIDRQVAEAIKIKNSNADILMNSKAEFHQPAVHRVITTRAPQSRNRIIRNS